MVRVHGNTSPGLLDALLEKGGEFKSVNFSQNRLSHAVRPSPSTLNPKPNP